MNKNHLIIFTALLTVNLQQCSEPNKKWWQEVVACCGLEECFPLTDTPSLQPTEIFPLITALANIESTDPLINPLAGLAKAYRNFNSNAVPGNSSNVDLLSEIINYINTLTPQRLLYLQIYIGLTYSNVTFPQGTLANASYQWLQRVAQNKGQIVHIESSDPNISSFFTQLQTTAFANLNAYNTGSSYPPAQFALSSIPTDTDLIIASGTALSKYYPQQ